jgi:hypothetical protein
MQSVEVDQLGEPKIYGVKIYQEGNGCYSFSVRHSGPFRLEDYDELEVEVKSARLVRKHRSASVMLKKSR